MKIMKKMVLTTPLILSILAVTPVASCSAANSAKPTSVSKITEEDSSDPLIIIIHPDSKYVVRLKVTNESELCGVQIGSKTKIQTDIYPDSAANKDLEYESANPDVAVVEDGYVVAKGKGHTKIKVTANMCRPEHLISTSFYVNVYDEGCKITFTNDGNGIVSKSYANVQVGSNFADVINNCDLSCVPNVAYKFDNWVDENNNPIDLNAPITSNIKIKATFARLVFETDTWENISNFAFYGLDKLKEIYKVDTFVGRTKKIDINGHMHEVRVIGEEHDTFTTGRKACLTFQLTTLLSGTDGNALETQWDTGNNYNYTHGYLKGNLNGNGGKQSWATTAWDMLPSDLKKCIKPVNKTIWEWNSEGEDGHFVNYSDNLFALTCTEYGQTNKDEEYHTEGTPYKYWIDHNNSDSRRFHDANGSNKDYWLASPCTVRASNWFGPFKKLVEKNDAWNMPEFNVDSHKNVESSCAVTFGFCI